MPTLHLLGTGAAVTDPHRHTTMLALTDDASTLVIDCGGDVVQRILQAGIDIETITGLFITHEHADHVSGFPLFMEKIWLSGRRRSIPVYGIGPALEQAWRCLAAFNLAHHDLPTVEWKEVGHAQGAFVLSDDTWRVTVAPGSHSVPVVGVRVESCATNGVVVFSGDTEPCDSIVHLARHADILVHEANGSGNGHTSALEAAHVAVTANVKQLLLTHLPPDLDEAELKSARIQFPDTELAVELGVHNF